MKIRGNTEKGELPAFDWRAAPLCCGLVMFQHVAGEDGRVQEGHNCGGGREDRERRLDEGDHDQGKDGQGHQADDPVLEVVDQAGGPGDHVDEDQVVEQFD